MQSILLVVIIAVTCFHGHHARASDQEMMWGYSSLPLDRIVEDSTPPFQIDPTSPFVIGLGRGSGWHGLNTVYITEEGKATLHRPFIRHEADGGQRLIWKTGELQLSEETIQEVIETLSTYHLFTLHRGYYANALDGAQWTFFLRQGRHGKFVYCDNHFPDNLVVFAEWLETLLMQHGLDTIQWETVPEENERKHEQEFWDSMSGQ